MNPITVDAGHSLIAGLHRMEAAKLLGWTEVECIHREAPWCGAIQRLRQA